MSDTNKPGLTQVLVFRTREFPMRVTTELWKTLCEEAANEQDPRRLLELVKEINDLLEEKQMRLNGKKKWMGHRPTVETEPPGNNALDQGIKRRKFRR